MSTGKRPKVAVVGLGAQGLVTTKNLLEEGSFDVVGFDKNDFVGGLWHYVAEHQLSALPTTIVNISRERGCFTDFPFPSGTSSYPNAAEIDSYLNAYCDHFKLRPHLRLGTAITSVHRDEGNDKWILNLETVKSKVREQVAFDKLVMAVGPHSTPRWPDITDRELFKGEITHSISFKDPQPFARKRVLVIGISNTAVDTATSLTSHASTVYLAHRDGSYVLPRFLKDGSSIDHGLTYRLSLVADNLDTYVPSVSRYFMNTFMHRTTTSQFGQPDPEWRILPAPGAINQVPTVSDTLIPALRAGTITSTHEPTRILPNGTDVELADGTILNDIDTIICCTGYELDLSILGQNDPTLLPNGKHDTRFHPRLYQNIFSLQYPNSLAFIGIAIILWPAFPLADLSSMALAQLWSSHPGSASLPSQLDMEDWYRVHCAWVLSVRRESPRGKIIKLLVRQSPWLQFVHDAARTNVGMHLDYGSLKAWEFWWNDRALSNSLMDGIYSPHLFRLFENSEDKGGRKAWSGARRAIEVVDEDVARTRAHNRRVGNK